MNNLQRWIYRANYRVGLAALQIAGAVSGLAFALCLLAGLLAAATFAAPFLLIVAVAYAVERTLNVK